MDESSGDSTTLAATAYTVDYESEPPRVYPSKNNEWPDTYDARKAVQIQFKAGYVLVGIAATASTPEPIRQWIKMRVGSLYENRESMTITNLSFVTQTHSNFDGLLDNYILPEVY
jgi:4-hydroxy-3-methylbut-2-enyl diphosphate reductase IspH